jgi:hypothetical protein
VNATAQIYRAEILRAVLGPRASELKVSDPARLTQIVEHMANCEEAQAALRAKGYGLSGMTFIEIVREVPTNALGRLKSLFVSRPAAQPYPDLGEVQNEWSLR